MILCWLGPVVLLLSVLVVVASACADQIDIPYPLAEEGNSDLEPSDTPEGGFSNLTRGTMSHPYSTVDYPDYGPTPGGGYGYGRAYSRFRPGYGEYRRRGGGYRQHRQYANPPLFPMTRQQSEQFPSDR